MALTTNTRYSSPLSDYTNYAARIRGMIINEMAQMEQMLDTYICKHFCHSIEKREELREVIISSKYMTYGAKCDILKCLLERNGDTSKKEAREIHALLKFKIGETRNMIAHCILDTSHVALDSFMTYKNTIYFHKYENTKKTIRFTGKEALKLGQDILAARNFLMGLISPFRKK